MAYKNLYEVFDEFEKANDDESRKEILRRNNSFALRSILRANFNPRIRFVFDKIPDYKPADSPEGLGYTTIDVEIHRIYLFEQDNPRVGNLNHERKKVLLIQMLEAMEAREAMVFSDVIMKRLNVKGLTEKLVCEVFTGIMD